MFLIFVRIVRICLASIRIGVIKMDTRIMLNHQLIELKERLVVILILIIYTINLQSKNMRKMKL